MAEAMVESKVGYRIAYFLGQNPAEARKISSMNEVRQAVEIGKIEAKLSTKPIRPSTAPPPPHIPKGSATTTPGKPLSEKNFKEFAAQRREQDRKKAQAQK